MCTTQALSRSHSNAEDFGVSFVCSIHIKENTAMCPWCGDAMLLCFPKTFVSWLFSVSLFSPRIFFCSVVLVFCLIDIQHRKDNWMLWDFICLLRFISFISSVYLITINTGYTPFNRSFILSVNCSLIRTRVQLVEIIILPLNNSVFCFVLIKKILPPPCSFSCSVPHILMREQECIFYFGRQVEVKREKMQLKEVFLVVHFRPGKIVRFAVFLLIGHFTVRFGFAPMCFAFAVLSVFAWLFWRSAMYFVVISIFAWSHHFPKISTLSFEIIV